MPFWFWLLVVLIAIPWLFARRWRFVATHLIVAPTLALLLEFALSTLLVLVIPRIPYALDADVILALYVVCILVGGFAGLIVGMFLAHRINKRLAWWPIPAAVGS